MKLIQGKGFGALIGILGVLLTVSAYSQDVEELFQRGNSLSTAERYEEALFYVDESLKMDSSMYQRYAFRAKIKAKLGMIDEAIEDITKCIHRCKCTFRNHHVSGYYLVRAELQLENKNQAAAMEDVNKSISSNPKNWEAYNFRSLLFIAMGQRALALNDLNTSFKVNDNESATLFARGKLRIELGDIEGACSDYSKLVEWGFDEFNSWISNHCKK